MKKTIAFLLCAALSAAMTYGCSEDYDSEQDSAYPQTRASADGEDGGGMDLEGLYFDPESGMWLIPADDAEEDDSSGDDAESEPVVQPFPFSILPGGFTPLPDPVPAYMDVIVARYLKIWPKNEEEIDMLHAMDDVVISYHSFDAVPLPTAVMKAAGLANTGIALSMVRYYEQEGEYTDNDGNIEPACRVAMPVLYAEWPTFKPYPDWMDYEVTGNKTVQVFRPDKPDNPGPGGDPDWGGAGGGGGGNQTTSHKPVITVSAWDALLGKYVNIPNVQILVQANTHNHERGATDMNGNYQCKNTYSTVNNLTITVYWSHPKFNIKRLEQTDRICPITGLRIFKSIECSVTVKAEVGNYVSARLPETIRGTLFRAAQFWFDNGHIHGLTTGVGFSGRSMRIFDYTDEERSATGNFSNNLTNSRIHIYNSQDPTGGMIPYFCTTLHELGHGSMFRHKGKVRYKQTGGMVKEGWACFTEWYVPAVAYIGWGYTANNPWTTDKVGPTRHKWEKSGKENTKYSPLFIDLMDDNNQGANNSRKSNDNIKDVPAWAIQAIAFNSYACGSFDDNARRSIGRFYNEQEYEDYFAAYHEGWK